MRFSPPKSMIVATIILMDILAGTEFDLFVPSFPELQKFFALTPFWVEALLSVNFLGYFLSLFCVGSLADRYGRRPLILLGTLVFLIGTGMCLAAASFELLMLGRFLQGLGIGAPATLSFLIIADLYDLKTQQSLFAILNGLMNASAGAAPVVGSYLTLSYHWQGNFWALLCLGIVVFVMSYFFIPRHQPMPEKSLLGGYRDIFKEKPLVLLMGFFVCSFMPYWIFVGMSPLLYMEDLGVPLTEFGYYQGSLALIFSVGSIMMGFVMARLNAQKTLKFSVYLIGFSFLTMVIAALYDTSHALVITLAIIPFVMAQIIPNSLLYPVCLNYIPQAKGRVSALLQGGRLVFCALTLQIAGYFYQGSFQNVGLLMCVFVLMSIVGLCLVMKRKELLSPLVA